MDTVRTKLLSFALVIFLLLSSFVAPLTVNAEGGKTLEVTKTDAKTLMSVIDTLEDDFNASESRWVAAQGNAEIVSELDFAPYSAYEGSSSLYVYSGSEDGGYAAISTQPKRMASLSATPIITLTVFVPESAVGSILTLALKTDRSEIKSSLEVECGSWQTLFFDMSKESGKIISEITVSLNNKNGNAEFLIDSIGGCRFAESIFASKYLSRAYEMHGGEITTEGGGLLISFSSGEKYIEAVPENTEYEEGSGIRVGLKNSSTCTSVTAVITTSDQKEIQTTHEITYGSTVFTIPVPDEQISSYRLIFNGDPKGKIEILSVMAVQCYSPKNTYGEISEVRISRDKKNITVKGSLSSEEFELLSGAKLRLYELGLDQDISDVTLSVSPISETELASSSFELSVPIDENFDRLFKKYAVAAITQNGLVHIGSAKAINNPNIFAEEKVTLPESIKGSSYLFDNYFLDGIAQTTVDVYADELISDSPNKISYTDGGRKYSFSADYVEMLDSIMKRYSIEGISVRFILKLRSPSENTVYSYLHHPQNSGGRFSAFNTTSSSGINTLRAITSFLVNRYSCGDVADNLFGIILGSDINDSYESYNMGGASLSSLVLSYSAAFRTVYNTARMICGNFEVSLPIDNRWYLSDSVSTKCVFEAYSFIDSFARCISDSTDIEWSLSCDITPENRQYAYAEASVDKTCFAEKITGANLEVPVSFMKRQSMLYNGSERKILLVGTDVLEAVDENDVIGLSCDYVYTYFRALSMKEICAYIPSHTAEYENAIRYVDTQLSSEKTAFASERIGKERFENLVLNIDEYSERYYLQMSSPQAITSSIKGKLKLFDFSKSTDGFKPHVSCATSEGGISYGKSKGLMRFRLSDVSIGNYGGVTAVLDEIVDLSKAPYLTFNIRTAVLPDGINELEVAVVIGSGRNTFVSASKIFANSDNTVICDVSSFPYASACDQVSIYVRGIYGTDIGEPTLLVSSIYAMSDSLTGTALKDAVYRNDRVRVNIGTVIAVIVCGVLAITGLVLRLIYGIRKRSAIQQKNKLN